MSKPKYHYELGYRLDIVSPGGHDAVPYHTYHGCATLIDLLDLYALHIKEPWTLLSKALSELDRDVKDNDISLFLTASVNHLQIACHRITITHKTECIF